MSETALLRERKKIGTSRKTLLQNIGYDDEYYQSYCRTGKDIERPKATGREGVKLSLSGGTSSKGSVMIERVRTGT